MSSVIPAHVSPDRWQLLEAHRRDLLAIARRRCASLDDAEDCVQEALLRVAAFPALDEARAARMLTAVVTRLAADTHRSRARHSRAAARLRGDLDVTPIDTDVCDRAEAEWIADHVHALPELQRDVLLARASGAEWESVAVNLRTSFKAVESAASRGRRTLRARLATTVLVFVAVARRLRSALGTSAAATVAAVVLVVASTGAGRSENSVSDLAPPSVEFGSVVVPASPPDLGSVAKTVEARTARPANAATPSSNEETYERARASVAGQDIVITQPPAEDPNVVNRVLACDYELNVDPATPGPIPAKGGCR